MKESRQIKNLSGQPGIPVKNDQVFAPPIYICFIPNYNSFLPSLITIMQC